MAEPTNDPTNRQLLEAIDTLKAENAKLADRVTSLERHAESTHKHFMQLARQVGGLLQDGITTDMQVIELMEKTFPGWAKAQVQIVDIFNSKDKAK